MRKPTIKEVQNVLWENAAILTGFMAKKIIDRFGNEGRKAIKEAMREAGIYKASKDLEKAGIRERGIRALADYMTKGRPITGFEFETMELSDTRYAIHVSKCPLCQAWKDMKAPSELCDLLAVYDEGAAKIFNPELSLKLPKHMLKGDSYCEYIFETITPKKGES